MIAISASIMCADLLHLSEEINKLENEKIEYLHLDVMDGHFVDNITLGIDLCAALGAYSTPRDIHMLAENPGRYVDKFNLKPGEIYQAHYECGEEFVQLADRVHTYGAKFGLVLNPETTIEETEQYLDKVDVITLMMIKPGFAGLPMEEGMLKKILYVRQWLDQYNINGNDFKNIIIEVDGHVCFENVSSMYQNGARIFVGGSSSIFKKDILISDGIRKLRNSIY
ncbi:MAG: ribulose-phosphate 3-epimerase [Clostridiales bacterium]|nr:ribulose-phosphate 3-epimerase [Clostridiales bacterium]